MQRGLSVVDVTTGSILSRNVVRRFHSSGALTPDGNTLYTTTPFLHGAFTIFDITALLTPLVPPGESENGMSRTNIAVTFPFAIVGDFENDRLFVASPDGITAFRVPDQQTGFVPLALRSISGANLPPIDDSYRVLTLAADNSRLYVSLPDSNAVAVVGTDSLRVLKMLPVGVRPVAVAAMR